MDMQNLSAPPCAQPLNPRGLTHINTPHTTRYTVVGNHLAQHRQLSLTAMGLALHIQSLPARARVDIKTLAARFPEGETRIAAALRELETHGYLARIRERLPSGRIVTHTVSYNQPVAQHSGTGPRPSPKAPPAPPPPRPAAPSDVPPPQREPSAPEPEPHPEPEAEPRTPAPPPTAKPPLPEPETPDPDRHRAATALLATLHHHDPRLLLAERDLRRLAPAAAAWLERGAHPDAVRHALTANLPREPLHRPASLLAHRLTELLPTPRPPAPARPDPFQTCEDCDRAFRSSAPGRCRDCRTDHLVAA
ncbi:helix-turn-helix domain-containing protein [Streptomyces phyllanthi]|uniref:helix-turn-helix domain-containing protein n=1 Tax=Streptomyces phyllanthi TaxID=1803180 RepID=UPI0031E6F4B7